MRNTKSRGLAILVVLLFSLSRSTVSAKVRVRIINKLGNNRSLSIQCQSQDNNLGYLAVPDGFKIEWKFSVNFWGTALFYCDVQWDSSMWHHFDAYSYQWDSARCQTECI